MGKRSSVAKKIFLCLGVFAVAFCVKELFCGTPRSKITACCNNSKSPAYDFFGCKNSWRRVFGKEHAAHGLDAESGRQKGIKRLLHFVH
jgi:hypothetical protein